MSSIFFQKSIGVSIFADLFRNEKYTMAIIGKIREKGWLVLLVVGVALLAFILGDWNRIGSGSGEVLGYGTIGGERVDREAFENEMKIARNDANVNTQSQARQTGQQQPAPNVDETRVWNTFVQDLITQKEYDALGIDVSDEEFESYIYAEEGFPVLEDFKSFVDSATQLFSPALLQQRIEQMQDSEDELDRAIWDMTKRQLIKRRKEEKYFDILEQGLYVTNLEAKNDYESKKDVKNISFAMKRYSEIPDEEVAFSDADLKAYYDKHKGDKKYFVKDANRKVEYFDIKIEPSAKDSAEFDAELAKLKDGFVSTEDDSVYARKNSGFYSSTGASTAFPKSVQNMTQYYQYPDAMDTVFAKAQVGDVVGPFQNEGNTAIVKVTGFTLDTINARHILLNANQENFQQVDAMADSLITILNNENFADLATQYSQDPGSKIKGGDLGDFFFNSMVPPFAMYCIDSEIGEIGKVYSQFGIHIVQVLNRKGKKYPRISLIQRTLKPSAETKQNIKMKAEDLLFEMQDAMVNAEGQGRVSVFDTIANKNGYLVRPQVLTDNNPNINYGFETDFAKEKILKLAFNEEAQTGDMVNSPIMDKDRYILAILGTITTEGEPTFESIKDALEREYIKEKKQEKLIAQMENKDLDKIDGTTVQTAEVTLGSGTIGNMGRDLKVAGIIFSGLRDGERSTPIPGDHGVWVVRIDKSTKAPAVKDYETEKAQLQSTLTNQLNSQARFALRNKAKVVDNRVLFQNGIRR